MDQTIENRYRKWDVETPTAHLKFLPPFCVVVHGCRSSRCTKTKQKWRQTVRICARDVKLKRRSLIRDMTFSFVSHLTEFIEASSNPTLLLPGTNRILLYYFSRRKYSCYIVRVELEKRFFRFAHKWIAANQSNVVDFSVEWEKVIVRIANYLN